MNDPFIYLHPFFNNSRERNVSFLSEQYFNIQYLEDIVNRLISRAGIKINPQDIVLLKPNLVLHPVTADDNIALNTHPNVLISVLKYIIAFHPKKIIIGDAPIQRCNWEEVIPQEYIHEVRQLSKKYDVPVIIEDFRKVIWKNRKQFIRNNNRTDDNYLIFDLGKESLLEPITNEGTEFRVTDYDPERMKLSHKPGMHKYCIAKEVFEATKVITLPKVKTHQKTGITSALKILVGVNGDKDFLPHHRKGGTLNSGDCYPGANRLMSLTESLLDKANNNRGNFRYRIFKDFSRLTWKLAPVTPYHNLMAAWYGNDTCWRMVLDLNKIVKFGTIKGEISKMPQREIFAMCDGIVGGQGNGPLYPVPLPMGFMSISNDSGLNDMVYAVLMGFDINKIPLLINSGASLENGKIFIKESENNVKTLSELAVKTDPPPGWRGFIETDAGENTIV